MPARFLCVLIFHGHETGIIRSIVERSRSLLRGRRNGHGTLGSQVDHGIIPYQPTHDGTGQGMRPQSPRREPGNAVPRPGS